MTRAALIRTLIVAVLTCVAAPSAALADSSLSTNWGGYAAHRAGVSFRNVSATWRQPVADCHTPYPTYEASWVGIGGYSAKSAALEQIGTELDCSAGGVATSGAWFELVPQPSRQIRMKVVPGDTLTASVTVVGHRVTLKLADRTRHSAFSKTVTVSSVDVSSAEWIVEAPSECFNDNSCRTLPLTDFGTESFGRARATTARGKSGSISSRLWGMSRITLAPGGRAFVAGGPAGKATPSALSAGGSAFGVTYSPVTVTSGQVRMAARAAGAGKPGAVNPGGWRG